jgi:hypothetical protein
MKKTINPKMVHAEMKHKVALELQSMLQLIKDMIDEIPASELAGRTPMELIESAVGIITEQNEDNQ